MSQASAQQQVASAPPPPRRTDFKRPQDLTLKELFESAHMKRAIEQAIPKHLSPERFIRLGMLAIQKTPQLAGANPLTFLGALTTCATLGLEPNTPLGHAYLIPFEVRKKEGNQWKTVRTDVQVIIGYTGFVHLFWQSKMVTSLRMGLASHAEFERGDFDFEFGSNAFLRHRHPSVMVDPNDYAFAYAFAGLQDGQAFSVMPMAEVHRIRNGSQGFQAAIAALRKWEDAGSNGKPPPAYTKAPWIAHTAAMSMKTPMRDLRKIMPVSVEVAAALSIDEPQDRTLLDFRQVGEDAISDGARARDRVMDGGVGEIDEEASYDFVDAGPEAGDPRFADDPPPPAASKEPEQQQQTAKTSTETAAAAPKEPAAKQEPAKPEDKPGFAGQAARTAKARASRQKPAAQPEAAQPESPAPEPAPAAADPAPAPAADEPASDGEGPMSYSEAIERIGKALTVDDMQWLQGELGRSKHTWSDEQYEAAKKAFKDRLAKIERPR